jgi:hypothetical protein
LDRRTVVKDRVAVMHDHATARRDPEVVPFDDLQQMARRGAEFLQDNVLDVGAGLDGDRLGMALDCLPCTLVGDPQFVADLLVGQVRDPQIPGPGVTFDGLGASHGPPV